MSEYIIKHINFDDCWEIVILQNIIIIEDAIM